MSVKTTQFEAENVKRIKALQITPAPSGLTGKRAGQQLLTAKENRRPGEGMV